MRRRVRFGTNDDPAEVSTIGAADPDAERADFALLDEPPAIALEMYRPRASFSSARLTIGASPTMRWRRMTSGSSSSQVSMMV